MKRTHDQFYVNEDNSNVKQSFLDVANEISKQPFQTLADIGCATGAFPGYLSKKFPNCKIVGVEYLDSLLEKARNDFPSVEFTRGNVLDSASVAQKFDVITMLGVLTIFDDYRIAIENVLSWLNPGGRLILLNLVSEFDIDVIIKYKRSSLDPDLENLESGWNIISEKSLSLVANANGAEIITSEPFHLNLDMPKRDDVMRSWTENNTDGGKDIYNALHIRQPKRLVAIRKH